jgi:hypothetical protein
MAGYSSTTFDGFGFPSPSISTKFERCAHDAERQMNQLELAVWRQ